MSSYTSYLLSPSVFTLPSISPHLPFDALSEIPPYPSQPQATHVVLNGKHYYTLATPKLWESFFDNVYGLSCKLAQVGRDSEFKLELPGRTYDLLVASMAASGKQGQAHLTEAVTLSIHNNFPYSFRVGSAGGSGVITIGKAR
jgi:hypothetical protein